MDFGFFQKQNPPNSCRRQNPRSSFSKAGKKEKQASGTGGRGKNGGSSLLPLSWRTLGEGRRGTRDEGKHAEDQFCKNCPMSNTSGRTYLSGTTGISAAWQHHSSNTYNLNISTRRDAQGMHKRRAQKLGREKTPVGTAFDTLTLLYGELFYFHLPVCHISALLQAAWHDLGSLGCDVSFHHTKKPYTQKPHHLTVPRLIISSPPPIFSPRTIKLHPHRRKPLDNTVPSFFGARCAQHLSPISNLLAPWGQFHSSSGQSVVCSVCLAVYFQLSLPTCKPTRTHDLAELN